MFCRMSLNWYLTGVSLMIKLRLWIWGMKTTEINYYSYCSFSVVPVINMTSHYQGYSCSAGWGSICQVLHFKITLFSPFSYYLLWKEVPMCIPPLWSYVPWGRRTHKIIWNLLHWRFVYSLLFIDWFNQLFISEWTQLFSLYFEL